MTEVQHKPENVGHILVKVQEDLQRLKSQLANAGDTVFQGIDLSAIDNAIQRTEEGLQQNTDLVVNTINNQVATLPPLDDMSRVGSSFSRHSRHSSFRGISLLPSRSGELKGERPTLHPSVYHDSPGQNMQKSLTLKALLNPENLFNRNVLNKSYGIVLPALQQGRQTRLQALNITKGSTIEPLSVLPKANRVDPSLQPPPIAEKDARKGILSLIERGLIPPAAELTLDPSPVHHRKLPIYHPDDIKSLKKHMLSNSSHFAEGSHHMASIKLDLSHDGRAVNTIDGNTSQQLGTSDEAIGSPTVPPSSANYSRTRSGGTRSPQVRSVMIHSPVISHHKSASSRRARTPLALTTFEAPLVPFDHPQPPPATPAPKEDQMQIVAAAQGYRFTLREGTLPNPPTSDPEFAAFRQRFLLQWGPVITMIGRLQRMLAQYAVPVAVVNGERFVEVALEYELEMKPTNEELISTLENAEEVSAIMSKPGRIFCGAGGSEIAATKIQATWRRYKARSTYVTYRRQRWAAGVIAISWIMHVRMSRMRKQLKNIRKMQADNFKARSKTLATEWPRICSSRRVVVHVPSLGYPPQLRFGVSRFDRKQNAQIGRLCELRDSNVDIIYVSPVEIGEELEQYYSKLLGLRSAVQHSDPANIEDMSSRFTIIVPEALNKFPTHHMCLSSLLKYSPRAMTRIKNLTRGRDAYLVPSVLHRDDLAVADYLGIPILGCDPEICHLYSSKSGARRVFAAADALVPPGEHDVYSLQQLHESLSRLICENPYIQRWLLKIDAGFEGRGIAYIDVAQYLPSYRWMLKESIRYGDKWNKKWAQDAAYNKILNEIQYCLERYAKPAYKDVYKSWNEFMEVFLSQGGIVEAYPPSESVTCLTVDMFIDPTGLIQMLSCGDQIHADNPLSCWGTSVPQASVDPVWLENMCVKVAEACRARGVIGHFSIDYVTYIDPDNMKQIVWATDLTLAYSDQLAMTQLMLFVSGGTFDPAKCDFQVPPPPKEKVGRFQRKDQIVEKPPPILNRYCVLSTNLLHSNMAVVHYSVFFQMCRAHGIGFDIKERQGTVFTLVDSSKRESMGMLTIGDDLPGTLASFARGLSVIHQEISAPNMQGKTNFKTAIDDIENILKMTTQNEEESEKARTDQSFEISQIPSLAITDGNLQTNPSELS
ncbi:IQ domain-containing protein H-like [Styela clava]